MLSKRHLRLKVCRGCQVKNNRDLPGVNSRCKYRHLFFNRAILCSNISESKMFKSASVNKRIGKGYPSVVLQVDTIELFEQRERLWIGRNDLNYSCFKCGFQGRCSFGSETLFNRLPCDRCAENTSGLGKFGIGCIWIC